jgi:hypothetical protein
MVPEPYNPQSLNRYSYCLNNPLIYVDPTGYQEEEIVEIPLEEIVVTAERNHDNDWAIWYAHFGWANYYYLMYGLNIPWWCFPPSNNPFPLGSYGVGAPSGGGAASAGPEGTILGTVECQDGKLTPVVKYNPWEGEPGGDIIYNLIMKEEIDHAENDLKPCKNREIHEVEWKDGIIPPCIEEVRVIDTLSRTQDSYSLCNGNKDCTGNLHQFLRFMSRYLWRVTEDCKEWKDEE